tara:strand:+ start:1590 stop:1769 length:180 start_codon:yes stop_codon:yes gene_type:complete
MNVEYSINVAQELLKALNIETQEDLEKARLAVKIKKVALMQKSPELEINKIEWLYKSLS